LGDQPTIIEACELSFIRELTRVTRAKRDGSASKTAWEGFELGISMRLLASVA